jgi:hypothetical protein
MLLKKEFPYIRCQLSDFNKDKISEDMWDSLEREFPEIKEGRYAS